VTGRLAGWRVLVTRQPEQARSLSDALAAEGALVVEVPLIAVLPPADVDALDAAVARVRELDWVAFTSANAVRAVAEACDRRGVARVLPLGVAAVGPSTEQEIGRCFASATVAVRPGSDFRAEGLADAFRAVDLAGRRVLLPVSSKARDTLAEALRGRGALVDAVVAYRTVVPEDAPRRIAEALRAGVDLVTLASPSAVESFADACPDRAAWPPAAVIGPVTADAARRAGFSVCAVAGEAGVQGLVDALSRLTRLG
jgi:uroporphyrinogen-III synthase